MLYGKVTYIPLNRPDFSICTHLTTFTGTDEEGYGPGVCNYLVLV